MRKQSCLAVVSSEQSNFSKNKSRCAAAAAFAASVVLLSAGRSAFAANGADIWAGTTDTNWATAGNWTAASINKPPISGDSLVFGADGPAGLATTPPNTLTNTLTTTAFNIAGITFNSSAPAYTMTGNSFNLTAGINNSSGVLQTFSNTGGLFTTVGTTYATGTGGISLSGLTFVGGGQTTAVTGTGGLTISALTLNNGARVTQTFNGTGNVTIGSIAPGTGGNSTLTYSGTGTLTVNGVSSINSSNTQDAVSSGTFLLASGGNIGQGISSSGAGTFTENAGGVLSGSGPVTQGSSMTMTLAGTNTYTGATTVNAGTLNLSGTINASGASTGSSVTVNGGAFNETSTGVLNGSGSGSTAGGQITLNSGTVDLQGANQTTGNETVNGGILTIDSTGGTTANVLKTNGVTLIIGGGTTNFLLSANATANTETVYQTQLTANTSSLVEVTQNGNTGTTGVINLANTSALSRGAGSIVDFGTLPTGTVLENTAGKANVLNGVLTTSTTGVAFATVGGGSNFASINTTTGVIGTVAPAAGTYSATANVSVTGGDTPASGAGANTLTFAGASGATLNLSGLNTITAGGILVAPSTTGTTTITGGTLRGGAGKELVVINNEPNTAGLLNISSIIADSTSGASALTIGSSLGAAGIAASPQRTVLTAANTFTGQTTLLNGTLVLSNALALQSSLLQANTGVSLVFDQSVSGNAFTLGGLSGTANIALLNNASTPAPVALNLNLSTGTTGTYSGVLSGTGASLTKSGAGQETLSGANTYTGATLVNGGLLYLNNAAAIKTSSSVTVNGTGLLGINQAVNESTEFATGVVIQGTGGITNEINNANTQITLDRLNTYTGQTTWAFRGMTGAGIASSAPDANGNVSGPFGNNSSIVFTNSQDTLNLAGFNNQVGSLSGTPGAGFGIQLRGATLTIGGDNTSTTYTGAISNNYLAGTDSNGSGIAGLAPGGNVIKIGTGTQTINSITAGPSGYAGTTTIKGGVLSINVLGTSGFAAPAVTTTSGSTTVTVSSTTGLVVGQNIFDLRATAAGTTITAINTVNNTITLSNAPAVGVTTQANTEFGFGSGIGISSNLASNLVLDGGTLQFTGAATTNSAGTNTNGTTDRLFTIGSNEAGGATGTLDASGTGALNFTNTGAIAYGTTGQARTLNLTGTNTAANTLSPIINDNGAGAVSVTKNGVGIWTLTGSNSYSGGTTVNQGVLTSAVAGGYGTGNITVNPTGTAGTSADAATLNSLGSIAPTAAVTVNSNSATAIGTVNFNGAAPTIGSLTGTGNVVLNNASGTALTTGNANNTTFSGVISDTSNGLGSLTKVGSGIFTLSGINAYKGPTTITAGTLAAGSSTGLSANSAFNVTGGTLDASAFNTSIASLNVGPTGSLNLGFGNVLNVSGTAAFSGTLNLSGTASAPEVLINYGSETGMFSTFTGVPAADQLSYNSSSLVLSVATVTSAPAPIFYTDASGDNMWNTTSLNFNNSNTGMTVAYNDKSNGTTGDNVTFNDASNGNYNVSLPAVVNPTSLTVSNSAGNYVFSGAGGINGSTGLVKTGTGSLTLNISNTYTGPTNVSGGSLVLGVAGALPAGTNLNIASGASVIANNLGAATGLRVGSLSVAGKLDLNNNALVVQNSTLTAVSNAVVSAYANGMWNGSSGITSSTAANDTSHLTTLGVILNSVNGTGTGSTLVSSLDGAATTSPSDVLVKFTYYGDANLDGKVDGTDYSRIDNGYLSHLTGWYNGDFNYDGVVDGSDYTLIDNAFNSQGAVIAAVVATPTAQIAGSSATSAVPEPTTLGLLGLGAMGLLGRRTRRRR